MWHQASYRGDELLVLGHNPRNNDCMLVKLSGLPMNEASDLRKIAQSTSAQASNYLIPVLQKIESPNGSDWFSYLAKKMEQRNSPVFVLPIKEVQDSLDADQKAIFKGYGKGRINRGQEMRDRADAYSNVFHDDEATQEDVPVAPTHLEQKIDTLTENTQKTNALLSKLVDVLLADKQPAKKPAVKTRVRARKTEEATIQV